MLFTEVTFSQVNGLCRFTPAPQVYFYLRYLWNVTMIRELRSRRFSCVFFQKIGIDVNIPFNS